MDNKTAAGVSIAAAAAVAGGIMAAVPNTKELNGKYTIDKISPYLSEIRIDVPREFTPDIVTLKMNDMEVAKTLLPQGYIVTYPTVVADTSRLSMDMYVRGNEAATAVFNDDGTLTMTVKKSYIQSDTADETPTTAIFNDDGTLTTPITDEYAAETEAADNEE